jgi:hypothetical protein
VRRVHKADGKIREDKDMYCVLDKDQAENPEPGIKKSHRSWEPASRSAVAVLIAAGKWLLKYKLSTFTTKSVNPTSRCVCAQLREEKKKKLV